jgi:FkbM family methyltransferase
MVEPLNKRRNVIVVTGLVVIGVLYFASRPGRSEHLVATDVVKEGPLADLPPQRTEQSALIKSCTPGESRLQAWHFTEHLSKIRTFSACGSAAWMRKYHQLRPTSAKLLIDIGGNKGYMASEFFSEFAPQLKFNRTRVFNHVMKHKPPPKTPCGACNDCKLDFDPDPSDLGASSAVTVHSFEPSHFHISILRALHEDIFATSDPNIQWDLHNKAVSDMTGEIGFPAECGTELCAISSDSNSTIPVTTVDDFVNALPSSSSTSFLIDILKIDTEGFDPAVLKGATRVLQAKQAAIVYFEYNKMNLWRTVNLKTVIEDLDELDYVCYFEGRPTLTRITGCWDNRFEFKRWSNVVCTPNDHFMYPALEHMSFRSFY